MIHAVDTLHPASLYCDAFGVPLPEPLLARQLRPRHAGAFIVHEGAAQAAGLPFAALAATEPEHSSAAPTDAANTAHAADATGADAASPASAKPTRVLVSGQWGLVPAWVKSASDARLRAPKLALAKSDLASTATAFRDAWLNGQRCIVPVSAFYVEDHRPRKPVPTRIARVDGRPMGLAALWALWHRKPEDPADAPETIISFALITLNGNNHALINRYGAPGAEKSLPVILNEGAYDAWLSARQEKAREFMRAFAAQKLLANPVENKADKIPKGWLE